MDNFRMIKIVALLLLIFAAGAAVGILLDRHYAGRAMVPRRLAGVPPSERSELLLTEFTAAMNLTPEQQKRVGALLQEWSGQLALHPEWPRAQRAAFIVSNSPALRTNLTAEQSVIFDRTLERMRRRARH